MNLIDKNKPIEEFTRQELQYILEKGVFRGKRINRAAKTIELNVLASITYNPDRQNIVINKKFRLDLNNIKQCHSTPTITRLKYWIGKEVFHKDQTKHQARIKNLADQIYESIHPIKLSSEWVEEKKQWREYKESWKNLDPDLDRLKAMTSEKHYDLLNQTDFSEPHKELLAQALKVRELFAETHYTFIHAQSLSYWIINQFVKELIKVSKPNQDISCFHFFRSDIEKKKVGAQEIIKKNIDDSRPFFIKKLLSVDAYFFHHIAYESTNSFLSCNGSYCHEEEKILDQILTFYLGVPNPELLNKLCKLLTKYQKLETIGNLYAICIPKEKVSEFVFRAHPYGKPCKCGDPDPLYILNELQNDNIPVMICGYNKSGIYPPQFRIVTDQLNPKDNPIFLISPVAKDIKDVYKAKLKKIAEETYAQK